MKIDFISTPLAMLAMVAMMATSAVAQTSANSTGTGLAASTINTTTTSTTESAVIGSNTANECVFGAGAGLPGTAAAMVNIPLSSCRIAAESKSINLYTLQVTGSRQAAGAASLAHLANIPRVKRTLKAQGLIVSPTKVSTRSAPSTPALPSYGTVGQWTKLHKSQQRSILNCSALYGGERIQACSGKY